jgi:hypothetical protein
MPTPILSHIHVEIPRSAIRICHLLPSFYKLSVRPTLGISTATSISFALMKDAIVPLPERQCSASRVRGPNPARHSWVEEDTGRREEILCRVYPWQDIRDARSPQYKLEIADAP